MISTSLKGPVDLNDMYVVWIPKRGIEWNNFNVALKALSYSKTFFNSVFLTTVCTLGHVIMCSFIAYGFARVKFRGRNSIFILVLFTLIVPAQVVFIPQYILNARAGIVGTYLPLLLPVFMGMGLRGGLFIFIFRQIFIGIPYELEDSARIDGCSLFKTYWNIIVPISKSAILVSSILSVVWHWNDYYEPTLYITKPNMMLLPMMLPGMRANLKLLMQMGGGNPDMLESFNEATIMAGTFLAVIPILIVYIIAQKQFMEGIERTGIVG